MRIRDLNVETIKKEIEELQAKPMTWETVEWLAALMTIKHRMEKAENEPHEHEENEEYHVLSREDAKEWVSNMRNVDGTYGEHWTCAQTKGLQKSFGYGCDEWEFYAVMNSLYSDFSAVLAEFGIPESNTACYAKMAKAWLKDEDAQPHKAMRYYEHVVE